MGYFVSQRVLNGWRDYARFAENAASNREASWRESVMKVANAGSQDSIFVGNDNIHKILPRCRPFLTDSAIIQST